MALYWIHGNQSSKYRPLDKLDHIMLFFLAFLLYCVCTQEILMKRLELIMGRNIPDNGTVTDHMMNQFIKREIMPHFEYGTFIDGEGLWKGELENTKIFYLECPDNEVDEHLLSMNCIAAAYKKQFRQDSVLISQVQVLEVVSYATRIFCKFFGDLYLYSRSRELY